MTHPNNWEEEFDAEFVYLDNHYDNTFFDLKVFIRSLIATERSKWIEETRQQIEQEYIKNIDTKDEQHLKYSYFNQGIAIALGRRALTPPEETKRDE